MKLSSIAISSLPDTVVINIRRFLYSSLSILQSVVIDLDRSTLVPVELSWEDVSCVVYTGDAKGTKTVLQKSSGSFLPGEFVAIVGPSGAGTMTTLLLGMALVASQNSGCCLFARPEGFQHFDSVVLAMKAAFGHSFLIMERILRTIQHTLVHVDVQNPFKI